MAGWLAPGIPQQEKEASMHIIFATFGNTYGVGPFALPINIRTSARSPEMS